jgi:Tol biopolymer transport system component
VRLVARASSTSNSAVVSRCVTNGTARSDRLHPRHQVRLDQPPDGESIAYTAYFGERAYLAVMNAEGSEQRRLSDVPLLRRLTGTAAAEEQPAWSPDGQKIAFASMDDGEIYAMKVDGSERTRLTDTPGYDHWPPTWSPDGTRIVFTSESTKGSEIYVMNSDGSGLTKLTDDPSTEDFYPAWVP